jgi:hypothetical protein
MSSSESPSPRSGISVFTLLGSFAGFALLFFLAQWAFGGSGEVPDPKTPERLTIKAEIAKSQSELLGKMGLTDEKQRQAIFEKTAAALQDKKPAKSAVVVPGSPTQLKQMSAETPPAAPAPATDGAPQPASK